MRRKNEVKGDPVQCFVLSAAMPFREFPVERGIFFALQKSERQLRLTFFEKAFKHLGGSEVLGRKLGVV